MNMQFSDAPPNIQSIVRQYARRRGITDLELAGYLNPQLHLGKLQLPGMASCVSRILRAIRDRERISVVGDFDCDGVTGTAILLQFFRDCTPLRPTWVLPSRQTDGYGLGLELAKRVWHEQRPQLVITVDCGTNSRPAVEFLSARGVETIVVDHHPAQGDLTTQALAIVNPKLHSPNDAQLTELCGAGLALVFCYNLAQACGYQSRWDNELAIILAGLGTLADACVMTQTNRALVKSSMRLLDNPNVLARSKGLAALVPAHPLCALNQRFLQFDIIPKLNALGRLANADPAVDLLTTDDAALARQIVAKADGTNRLRQQLQQKIVESASNQAQVLLSGNPQLSALILADAAWHHGVVGPAASRIVENFNRSAILLGQDGAGVWRGSGRSFGRDDLGGLVARWQESGLITRGGGHSRAVGLAVTTKQLERLQRDTAKIVVPQAGVVDPETEVIGMADHLDAAGWRKVFEMLEPFGRRNPFPILLAAGCHLGSKPQALRLRDGTIWAVKVDARTRGGRTLRVTWRDHHRAAQEWRMGRRYDLELELSWKLYEGALLYNWHIRSSVPCRPIHNCVSPQSISD
jgi:single-stranded-DNA-specific exonuclease